MTFVEPDYMKGDVVTDAACDTHGTEDLLWPLLAYGDRWSVTAGDALKVMVSSVPVSFDAELVRLGVWGAPALEERVASSIEGSYPGRLQALHAGSYVRTSPVRRAMCESWSVQAWVFPTLIGPDAQTIISQQWVGDAGWALELDERGRLQLREWSSGVQRVWAQSPVCLSSHTWYFVAGVIDRERLLGRVRVTAVSPWMRGRDHASEEVELARAEEGGEIEASVHIGACQAEQGTWGTAIFNGKIESPRLFCTALSNAQLDRLANNVDPAAVAPGRVAGAWDMSAVLDSTCVPDRSLQAAHGTCVNMPTRAVTGHNWQGQTLSPEQDPSLYGAIHFHEDDLEDAGWAADFELPITHELSSGIYAIKLTSGEDQAYVPFYVRPPRGARTAPMLFIAPTNTYLAYANNRVAVTDPDAVAAREDAPLQPIYQFVVDHPALGGSLYDTHRDGSGVCYASRLRPTPDIDPRRHDSVMNAPRRLPADLHLLAWLAAQGQSVDIATDEDLHREGTELLLGYRVVLTGSHPEYYSGAMLDALSHHLELGGNLMYLGGNGFYWVTTFHPEHPHVIEVRKGFSGTRNWQVAAGEEHHSTTGERGGLWRHRGRAANGLVGVGSVGHGFAEGVGYRRLPNAHDEQTSFIFEGVKSKHFGRFGLALNGAAGDEMDATDLTLGTPAHATVLACSETLAGYFPMLDDELVYSPNRTGEHNPRIRSELVYFETGHGGAVFSVGSISWCAALSHNDYDNDISTITANVLRAFLDGYQRA
jgi:N,N-dimethylformamidase